MLFFRNASVDAAIKSFTKAITDLDNIIAKRAAWIDKRAVQLNKLEARNKADRAEMDRAEKLAAKLHELLNTD